MNKTYDVDEVQLQGRADTGEAIRRATKGDKIVLVVEGTVRAFEDSSPAHRGDIVVAKARVGECIVLTGDEYDEFMGRLSEQRADRKSPGQTTITDAPDDEYSGLSHFEARALCKDRGLNARGSRDALIQRLRENG